MALWRHCRRSRVAALALLAGLCLALPASTTAAPLEVRIGYGRTFDDACSLLRGYRIGPAWRTELKAELPELRRSWNAEGRPLLDRASRLVGRRLTGRRDVRLTLCNMPSSSWLGTSVNMRHALNAFTPHPVPLRYKANIIAHELLHDLIVDRDLSSSPMLAAHARESARVRSHLHLFALMKAALLAQHRPAALRELRRIDAALPGGHYRRAWEIVEASPDAYLAYVAELRRTR